MNTYPGAGEDDLLISKLRDAVRLCEIKSSPRFVGFLDTRQAAVSLAMARKEKADFGLFGGYDDAERVVMGLFPHFYDKEIVKYPVTAITFSYRKADKLTHRDFLGSLMALGIKRECIGDILVEDSRAVIFVIDDIAQFIMSEVTKVGKTGVRCELGLIGELPAGGGFEDINDTVASARLDNIVSALLSVSRGKAEEKILLGLVSIDGLPCEKSSRTVSEGSVIRIRGAGKFIVDSLSGRSKKGRVLLRARKYI